MTILAVLKNPQQIDVVLPWAATFARAREKALKVICLGDSPHAIPAAYSGECDQFVAAVKGYVANSEHANLLRAANSDEFEIKALLSRDFATSVIKTAASLETDLLVASADDPTGENEGTYATNGLLRQSPFNSAI